MKTVAVEMEGPAEAWLLELSRVPSKGEEILYDERTYLVWRVVHTPQNKISWAKIYVGAALDGN